MHPKIERRIEKSILFVPLFAAFSWLSLTVLRARSAIGDEQLSPSRIDGLVTALFIFIIIYSLILLFLFFKMNKKLKEHNVDDVIKKEIKKVKKKK